MDGRAVDDDRRRKRLERVLVADDDERWLDVACEALRGRQVAVERDARCVIERVREFRPDLVILDLWFHGWGSINGRGLAAALKFEHPGLPIVVISAGLTVPLTESLSRRRIADLVLAKQGPRTFDLALEFFECGAEPELCEHETETFDQVLVGFANRLLAQTGGNKAAAARRAGVSWVTFHRWLARDPGQDEPKR